MRFNGYETYDELCKKYREKSDALNRSAFSSPDNPISETEIKKKEDLAWDRKNLASRIMAHPRAFDTVRCWMIDVCGSSSSSEEDLEEFLTLLCENGPTAIDKVGGLAQAVRKFITDNGFTVTDSGGGAKGWHIGTPCTDSEAQKLCTLLLSHFDKAIKCGALVVERKPWALQFIN